MLRPPARSFRLTFRTSFGYASALPALLAAGTAVAQETTPSPAAPPASAAGVAPTPAPAVPVASDAPKPKPPPYSLPFALRSAIPATVIRSDTALALYESPTSGKKGSTVASMLLGSYKVTDEFAPMVRLGVVSNSPPAPAESGSNFLNPVLGATYGLKLAPELRLSFFLGVTVPIGGGGGNSPSPPNTLANAAGIRARSAMDNAMFAVNDFTVFPGVDFAFVSHGFTAQVEATVFQLTRVRGADAQKDSSRTNFTTGVHVGYFLIPELSLGVELRHQRWLSTPAAVEADKTNTIRDTTTFAVGPRFHFKVGETSWIRPALSFAMALDNPMKDASYKIFQLDVPFVF